MVLLAPLPKERKPAIGSKPRQLKKPVEAEHFPAKWTPVSRKKMLGFKKVREFLSQKWCPLLRNAR
jgi:hypothetical protein